MFPSEDPIPQLAVSRLPVRRQRAKTKHVRKKDKNRYDEVSQEKR